MQNISNKTTGASKSAYKCQWLSLCEIQRIFLSTFSLRSTKTQFFMWLIVHTEARTPWFCIHINILIHVKLVRHFTFVGTPYVHICISICIYICQIKTNHLEIQVPECISILLKMEGSVCRCPCVEITLYPMGFSGKSYLSHHWEDLKG